MTDEIRKRIEQVIDGEIPEGYHKKFCLAPNKWDEYKLSDLCKKKNEKNNEFKYDVVLSNTATQGVIRQADYFEKDIANAENIDTYFIVKENDFVYNPRISSLAPYGPIHANELGIDGIVSPLYTVFNHRNEKVVSFEYLKFYFVSSQWNKYMYSIANYGARHDRMNIGDEDFFNLPIWLPPSEEQKKIVEILILCEKIITLKNQLIAEEYKRKEWLMQNLLNPNGGVHLEGFEDEWSNVKISSLCNEIVDGDWIESKDQNNFGFRLIQTGNIGVGKFLDKNDRAKYVDEDTFNRLNCTEVLDGDLLISRLPDPIGRACIIDKLKQRSITAVDCSILRFKNQNTAKYILQYMCSSSYFKKISVLSGGSTRTRVTRKEIENLRISLPKSIEEQIAITNILSISDRKIELLEQELEQWQQKKKSLMQLLLTGIVRVNV